MTPRSYSAQLAERIAAFRLRQIPAEVVAQARLVLLDTLGAMLAASSPRYSATRILVDFARRLGGRPESSVVGQRARTSCVTAALVNGTLGYYCDIEPHHVQAILHGPAVMVPTSLAVAEKTGATGARFLEAMILGVEVAGRVSEALDPVALYGRGFHPSAVCGAFGAAAVAGRLFGLPAPQQAIALGLAMQQASGLLAWASDHTENSRPLNPGLAARNGTTAAYLASLGFGGPPAPFDGQYDAFTAFSGTRRPEALLADWGQRYYVAELAFKRYACCAFTHPGLDALLELAAEHRLAPRDVHEIVVRFPRSGAHMIDGHALRSHCAQYVLPVGLVFGQVMIDDILTDRAQHPEVARLRGRTRLVPDEDLDRTYPARYATIVEVSTTDGRRLTRRVDSARGARENPLGPDEIREKYDGLASTVASPARAERLAALVERIERLPDLGALTALLRTPAVDGSTERRVQPGVRTGRRFCPERP